MRLVTFVHNGAERLGALVARQNQEFVVDLNAADPNIPGDMIAFLKAGHAASRQAQHVIDRAESGLALSALKLKAPVPRPGKIICIGLNYSDHAREANLPIPEYPVVFSKYNNTVIGPGDAIVLPRASQEVDYEAELGFVIGRRGHHIPEHEALSYVAGYLAVNDVSARDFQRRTSQWTIGKVFDTFAPMGPALVTADEVPDPHQLAIRLTLDGEVMQDSSTSNLIFNIPQLVASLSEVMTLEAGDVVSTGTPPGVGMARKPPRYMRAGEVVSIHIERVGTLTNPVVAEGE